MAALPSLSTVLSVCILDNDGQRIWAKYYTDRFPTVAEQRTFEKKLFGKTHRSANEIILLDRVTVVYRSNIDLHFFVMGAMDENEIMLHGLLSSIYECVSRLVGRNAVEKKSVLECMDGVQLIVDESVDGGIILEADPDMLMQRLNFRQTEEVSIGGMTDKTVMNALNKLSMMI
ncbi:coatomer subunit zeta-1-like [Sycon ciliatum]|uniref:coatomer subunit zeta-1-like n=1 Tax=Sycon ciliatum TaxID=27933 RepID=UPI0020AE7F0A|eukprot:scpid82589/ scgid30124/ Coatomer subunit zeta-1; Zeta-1-coat protein; Coatomer subunit zeta-1; Zeta-1-coat protein; Coatomer subunit zeta-1; Zeta-1-coat protein